MRQIHHRTEQETGTTLQLDQGGLQNLRYGRFAILTQTPEGRFPGYSGTLRELRHFSGKPQFCHHDPKPPEDTFE